jgi:DNA-binding IclR family transcriptional regulator
VAGRRADRVLGGLVRGSRTAASGEAAARVLAMVLGVLCMIARSRSGRQGVVLNTPRVRLIQSTLRCLEVLDALAASEEPVSVSELARRLNGRRGTLHQQLQTLVHAGWARQTPEAKYYLSLRALHVGKAALAQAGLAERLLPSLQDLADRTGEATALAVLDGVEVLIIQRVESPQLVRADIRVGTRMPLSTSAAGLVLLAYADADQRSRLRDAGVTIPVPEVLDEIRRRGYAVQKDEYQSGLSSVAVPVTIGSDEELLTLSMAAPTERFDEARAVSLLLETQQGFYRG